MRLPKIFHTSIFRLTLAYAGLFTISAVILFGVVYWSTSSYMTREIDSTIGSDLSELREIHAKQGTKALIVEIEERIREDPNGPIYYLLEDKSGKSLAGNLDAIPPTLGMFKIEGAVAPTTLIGRSAYAHGIVLGDGKYLAVANDAYPLDELKKVILRTFVWSFVITLLLAFGGGIFVSRKILHRVELVSHTSRDIIEGNLSRRIPIRGVDDEFDHLATSLNLMLDQTENLMEGMRQVSNDIAHDLRTPLSRLRQRLELAQRIESAADLRAAIHRSIADTDAILETFGALLRIAQIETRLRKQNFAPVNLSYLLQTVIEVYQSTADEKGQRLAIDLAPDIYVFGDRELLAQMLSNLIENAIRHSPRGASIALSGKRKENGVEVVVADTGPGIPVDERNKVFRRFYRLESSRSTPGNGLGLSLVAAVAALHGMDVALVDNHPGLRVCLAFPNPISDT